MKISKEMSDYYSEKLLRKEKPILKLNEDELFPNCIYGFHHFNTEPQYVNVIWINEGEG